MDFEPQPIMALSPFGAGFGAFDMFPFGRGNVMRDPFELVLPSLSQVAPAAGHAAHPLVSLVRVRALFSLPLGIIG